MEYISKSEKQTYKIAKNIIEKAEAGDIFALRGNLGSGKTTFVKGAAYALGIKRDVTSPTFVIMKQYRVKNQKNLKNIDYLIHIDCYRIETIDDAYGAGLSDAFNNNKAITFIEWPEKISSILPAHSKYIDFEFINETERKIKVY